MIFFRFLTLCVFVLMIGCGKNLEPKPEPITEPKLESKSGPKLEPKSGPKSAEQSAPNKENKKNDGIFDVKAGESFEYGNLSITVIDVLKHEEILLRSTGIDSKGKIFEKINRFTATFVQLKFENKSAGKIDSSPGLANSKASLEDEFGNILPLLSRFDGEFTYPGQKPETGWRIDPGTLSHYALYFQVMPVTSKEFILTLRLNGKTVRCKGIMGEATRLNDKKREQDLIAAKEKEKQQMITTEAARKKDFESKNLTYYPSPVTKYMEKTADQWHKMLIEAVSNNSPKEIKESFDSLKELNDEGVPYLVDFLVRQSTPQGRELALIHIYACKIHPNDLPKIIDCLNKTKNQISARVMALNILSRSGNAKPFYSKIQPMVVDLLMNKNVKDSVKEYLDKINS